MLSAIKGSSGKKGKEVSGGGGGSSGKNTLSSRMKLNSLASQTKSLSSINQSSFLTAKNGN